ncbi:tetratricopeptide repeat protein [Zestomonas carbonaria]|uniref:PelB C-terminal domain-containing protein n=1 Tax=Zestomonas carbonaria TaxID=2762745 RepID=A0A7U7EPD9_9GAMM|nr:tetratricopeptide repeat protein [Pseudomonas carbonaria]CAD5108739.1 hypothetical protein PSEWESI4_03031 [Pseudomonas carbonaria]
MVNLSVTDNSEKTRLLNPWMIVLVALIVAALLALSYKSEEVFLPADDEKPDAVAIGYTELLLQAHPDDDRLRVRLIDQLIQFGDLKRAREYLSQFQERVLAVAPFYAAVLDILGAQANPEGIDEAERLRLVEQLRALDRATLDNAMLERQARHALHLDAPDVAVLAYLELAERDPKRRQDWLDKAARWSLAMDDQGRAAQLYLQLADAEQDPAKRTEYLHKAFSSLLAADKGEQAAELLAAHLDELGSDQESLDWLADGVLAAQGNRRYDLAELFIQRWRGLRENDSRAIAADFRLSLASGAIERAWQLGPELLGVNPGDRQLLAELARLGEWTGHPQQALEYWIELLKGGEEPTLREHAWRLALQLFDFDSAVGALAALEAQRQMSDEEVDALVYSHETRGTPEDAEAWLRGYVRHYPGHRYAWQRLQMLLENTQQLQEETPHWAAMAQRFPLSLEERIRWAETHWNLFELQQAWDVLTAVDADSVVDPEYWSLRASLAWDLERDEETRLAYERLQALDVPLARDDEDRLISLYWDRDPRRALTILTESWQRTRNPLRLVIALQLAEVLHDWKALKALLEDAESAPNGTGSPQYWIARAALAAHEERLEEAEQFYREALTRFPEENLVRERMLWFHIDHGQREALAPLLQQWRARAYKDSRLWLPFATGHLLLNRTEEALAWFRLYIKSNPADRLVQAAYADALDAAGYQDRALRLRRQLLAGLDRERLLATPEGFAAYLRLLTVSQGPLLAQREARRAWNGEPAMLEVWFEHFLEQLDAGNRSALKDDWLAWARARGLKVNDYEQVQQALRTDNRVALERMLARGNLDPAHQVEVLARLGHGGEALGTGLSALGDEQSASVREQLLHQTTGLLERTPQGLQLGWRKQDYGDLDFKGPSLEVARHLGDDWYADLKLGQGRYDSDNLDSSVMGSEHNAQLLLRRELSDGALDLTLDSSWRDDEDRHGFGLERIWRLSSRDELGLALDWHRETEETGLLRALGMRDSISVRGQHGFSARDQLAWSLAHNRYSSRQGDDLGSGEAVSLEWGHALFFDDPSWLLRSGVDYQHNRVESRVPDELLAANGGAFVPFDDAPGAIVSGNELLQDRYGQVYFGSTWRRGFPGALNRTRPQFTWMVDTLVGWQWTEREFNYGINVGLGMELLGDDELAFTAGYQSAPRGGEGDAGGSLGVTYSTRFGR